MKIAIYISPAHTVPPESNSILAPWWLVSDIADGLVDRGHEVTLFAAAGSKTKAEVVDLGILPFDYRQGEMTEKKYQRYATFIEQRLASVMYQRSTHEAFDVISNHLVAKTLPFTRFTKTPTVFTLHDPLEPDKIEMYEQYNDVERIYYVSVSNSQRAGVNLPFVDTIYHGIRLDNFIFSAKGQGNLLVVGRIRKEKGFTDAIAAAKKLGLSLVISGEYFPQYPEIATYWEKEVKPYIDGEQIIYTGKLPKQKIAQLYQQASALLFPIHWEEPFGLVMIEAMACGTPVIAYNRGSVPEIVKDGVTGFIVDPDRGVDGLVEAVGKIDQIDRAACRKHVEEHFTVEKMVEGYENVYRKVLNEQ